MQRDGKVIRNFFASPFFPSSSVSTQLWDMYAWMRWNPSGFTGRWSGNKQAQEWLHIRWKRASSFLHSSRRCFYLFTELLLEPFHRLCLFVWITCRSGNGLIATRAGVGLQYSRCWIGGSWGIILYHFFCPSIIISSWIFLLFATL